MNVLTATGNLGQDCKTNNVNGTAVVNFSVAMKAGFGDKAQTVWLDCSLWGKQAESRLPEFLVKGQQVAVSGELSTFKADNGETYLKLRCNSVDLIGKKDDSPSPHQSAPAQSQPAQQSTGGQVPEPVTDFDDDIPF
tara:strand:+ start:6902 stop:7312 length:411 start_codon:yes stop_codon:yes gene_type:complete